MKKYQQTLETILFRSSSEMRAEVAAGSMGMFIWILEPLLYLSAFYIIFSALNLRGGKDAVPFLLIGLIVWKWFAYSVYRGAFSIMLAAAIMQQIHVPKYIFLVSTLLSGFYQFLIVFVFLILFLLLYGIEPNWGWLNLTVVIFLQFFLIMGIAGLFAVLLPFATDLQVVISNGLTLIFFMSGIFFDVSSLSEYYQRILYLNPMVSIIETYRDILLTGHIHNWSSLGIVAIVTIILIAITIYLIRKWDKVYPKVLPA